MHELVAGVVAPVSTQEVQITPSAAVATALPCGAVNLLVSWVVAQALSTPCGDVICVVERFSKGVCVGGW